MENRPVLITKITKRGLPRITILVEVNICMPREGGKLSPFTHLITGINHDLPEINAKIGLCGV